MIIYYEGTQNEEFLYTDCTYYDELAQIDKEEYDIQPVVRFSLPGLLLSKAKILLNTKISKIDESTGLPKIVSIDYEVVLDEYFGTRQTELIYLTELADLIQEAARKALNDTDFLVKVDPEWLTKHSLSRFRFTGKQTTIKFPEQESYWLAKMLGAKPFVSNNYVEGKTNDCEGNEIDENGLITRLNNKTMYITNSNGDITFDYTFYINFIKSVFVTCKYITKQTVLVKYKKYIILRHDLDVTPLARVKITSDFLSTISKDQLYKGLSICFCDENFKEIPLDPNTFYEIELHITKSRKRAQLEVDRNTINANQAAIYERRALDEQYKQHQRATQQFELNFENNRKQYETDYQIYKDLREQIQANTQQKNDAINSQNFNSGQIPKDYEFAYNYFEDFIKKGTDNLEQIRNKEENLYKQACDFTLPVQEQYNASAELSRFYQTSDEQPNIQYNYIKLAEQIKGAQTRVISMLKGGYGDNYVTPFNPTDEGFKAERNRVNIIQSSNLRQRAQTALQEFMLKNQSLNEAMKNGLDKKTVDKLSTKHKQEYEDTLNRYTQDVQQMQNEYNEDIAEQEAYKVYLQFKEFEQDQKEKPDKQLNKSKNYLYKTEQQVREGFKGIAQKYAKAWGKQSPGLEFNPDDVEKYLEYSKQRYEQEQQQKQQQEYIELLLSTVDDKNYINTFKQLPVEQQQNVLAQLDQGFKNYPQEIQQQYILNLDKQKHPEKYQTQLLFDVAQLPKKEKSNKVQLDTTMTKQNQIDYMLGAIGTEGQNYYYDATEQEQQQIFNNFYNIK
ncbi:Hypothetical_protein [Hexamita inflata]|uniref:Hypothetical_protein n=1 Tax=Hexamita inflata TaxID=28002 RepID=A0AA86QIW4_9EUKA|nr:Hypothetical protein HINF_LOCUS43058 [Hexamita inflata]